ncbi:MAG: cell division/cell wall cluster transcriptional repressor MraZ [Planctomycetota bacterium]
MSENILPPFFYGQSEHKINSKGQAAMPARFRAVLSPEALAQGFVLLRGEAPCIYCYTHGEFRDVVARVMADEETRNDAAFLRDFFEQVYAVDMDSQGRIVIPAELRAAAGISGSAVVFIGHNDRVEIWDASRREGARKASRTGTEDKRERMARRIFGP